MAKHIPAFPRTGSDKPYRDDDGQIGMTLRDYFAGQCLSALIARHRVDIPWMEIAPTAYKLADEMLKEREK